MNITKKVKIMIIVVWLTALVSMVIGTCIIKPGISYRQVTEL